MMLPTLHRPALLVLLSTKLACHSVTTHLLGVSNVHLGFQWVLCSCCWLA
jgi:hypothetical protein